MKTGTVRKLWIIMALLVAFSGVLIGCKKTAGDNSLLALLGSGGSRYKQTAKLIDTNTGLAAPAASDQDGGIVSISGDGGTIAMGTWMADKYTLTNNGAVLLFRPVDDVWTQFSMSWGGESNMRQGSAALSDDGSLYALGAGGYNTNTGIAYIETWDTGSNQYLHTETGSGSGEGVYYGTQVALSGDGLVAAVAATGESGYKGVVDIWVNKAVGGWTKVWSITASDGANGDSFGGSMSISGNGAVIVVGVPLKDNGSVLDTGAVYVYNKDPIDYVWGGYKNGYESQKLVRTDGVALAQFGNDVAISTDGRVIAANVYSGGMTVLYMKGIDGWEERDSASPPDGFGGGLNSVALNQDGSVLAVGVINYNAGYVMQGAVFVFKGNNGAWDFRQILVAEDAAANAYLGFNVSMSADGGIIVAGAPGCDIGSNANQGAAYVFEK